MTYQLPADAFCNKFHKRMRTYVGLMSLDEPKDPTLRTTFKVLTALSSICAQRREDSVSAALYFDPDPRIVLAANVNMRQETKDFVASLFDTLRPWSPNLSTSDPGSSDRAVKEVACEILAFQAERWIARLHDNPCDRVVWDTRLKPVNVRSAALDDLLSALQSVWDHARALESGSGPRSALVQQIVCSLLDLDAILACEASQSALQAVDLHLHMVPERVDLLLNAAHPLVIDDVTNLEDEQGNLIPMFSLTRYLAGVTAPVRYARQLVDFASSTGKQFFCADSKLRFWFCDERLVLDDCNQLVWALRRADDPTHAPMRILAALLENEKTGMVPIVGSSALMCLCCYHALIKTSIVENLPDEFEPILSSVGCTLGPPPIPL